MRHRVFAAGTALAVMLGGPVLIGGQSPSGATTTPTVVEEWRPPARREVPARTPDGQPNLQGVYSYSANYTPLERPAGLGEFFTEEQLTEWIKNATDRELQNDPGVHYDFSEWGLDKWQTGVFRNRRTSIIVDPPDGRLPALTEEAKKRPSIPHVNPYWKGLPNYSHVDLGARCLTGYWYGGGPMLRPNGNGAQGETEILQTPGYVVIFTDSNNDTRIIPLDGRPRLSPNTKKWYGDSRGHWEGETLVVETTNFNERAEFNSRSAARVTNGKNLPMIERMIERFTRATPDTLRYQFTVEDPKTWTRPWSGEVSWPRVDGPMYEAACTEENYSLLNVLKGLKHTEEEAAKSKGLTEVRRRNAR